MFSFYYVYFGLLFAAVYSRLICAQTSFSMGGTSSPYKCSINLICLGDAHTYTGDQDGSYAGNLSLVRELEQLEFSTYRSAIAYYSQPVRMLDSSTRQSASFNTSFAFAEVTLSWNMTTAQPADGITFVISAENSTTGSPASSLGFFDSNWSNRFKSIVVEFDNYPNRGSPIFDIGPNHVSFDFMDISAVVARNASDVDVELSDGTTYAWVEYSAETKQLEVRISKRNTRPSSPFLNYKVNLFDVVDEYMWVGFSGSTGGYYSYYYIGNWSFESYGIPEHYSPVPTPTKARSKVGIIVGVSVGVLALLAIVGVFILYFVIWRSNSQSDIEDHPLPDPLLKLASMAEGSRFSCKELSVATGDFREESKLGEGGSGSVYHGVLPTSGIPVAVKKITGETKQSEKQFMAEILTISQLRHRNLIQILGWCKDSDNYLIVYELMPKGSLDQVLFRLHEKHPSLTWAQRFSIVRGTAAALDYLQSGWNQQVIHRDIKSSNIMLDDEWNAKLGDFGLARLVDHHGTPATTKVAGTWGYIAPEAATTGKFTDKTDVFSFGAVALEIACGRRSVSWKMPAEEIVLVDWVWERLSQGDLLSVVDRRLDDYDAHWMEVVLRMGLLCSHPDPLVRPTMRRVVQMLDGDAAVPSVPSSKPATVFVHVSRTISKSLSSPIEKEHSSQSNTWTGSTSSSKS